MWKIEEGEDFFKGVPLQREIKHPQKRLQHLAARYLLSVLFEDFPYEEILIADTRKPFLQNEAYHFSLSHSGDLAAAIASRTERVGIDVEIPAEKIENIATKFLNEGELLAVSDQLSAMSSQQLLTVLWCAKEAVFKWWSFGEVDFKEHILLEPFSLKEAGRIAAKFKKDDKNISVEVDYKLFAEFCVAWVAEVI